MRSRRFGGALVLEPGIDLALDPPSGVVEPIWQSWSCIIDQPEGPTDPAILRELTIVVRTAATAIEAWFGSGISLGFGTSGPLTWGWAANEFDPSLCGKNYSLRMQATTGLIVWPARVIAVSPAIRIPAYGEGDWSGSGTNPA